MGSVPTYRFFLSSKLYLILIFTSESKVKLIRLQNSFRLTFLIHFKIIFKIFSYLFRKQSEIFNPKQTLMKNLREKIKNSTLIAPRFSTKIFYIIHYLWSWWRVRNQKLLKVEYLFQTHLLINFVRICFEYIQEKH
jgi:hypothetical protein